jgi:class 3 adenylate cyclase
MSAVRALLLTDVVDSTALSETLGDAEMAVLWAAHDRLARDLLPHWRGREIDKTDGMLLLFDAAPDAVAYAIAYHRALATLDPPLKARAGLHVGPVILRENSPSDVARGAKPIEAEGAAKAVAARVMSIANGGQTLLSADARNTLGEIALRLESHGHWRMKGIAEPLELFEIGAADAPFAPPPDAAKCYRVVREGEVWLPVRDIRRNLPAERDAFVGRKALLLELAHRLDTGARLVSVLGIGGAGKTRLVTRFGWSWLGDFPGGAWFCDLSQARSLDGIVHAVAQ